MAATTIAISLEARTRLELRGTDRLSFLHNLCTNDVGHLLPGTGREAFFTSAQGKLVGHALLYAQQDRVTLVSSPKQAAALEAHLDRYIIREDVVLEDTSMRWDYWLFAGAGTLERFGTLQPAVRSHALGCARFNQGEESLELFRVPWLGDVEAVLMCCSPNADWQSWPDFSEIPTAATDVWDAARVEAGWPEFGLDIDSSFLAQEVSRDAQAISFTKGCYLGQETVARIDALGHVNRQLGAVSLPVDIPGKTPFELTVDDRPRGTITSIVHSPRLAHPLGIACLRREISAVGTTIESPWGEVCSINWPAQS